MKYLTVTKARASFLRLVDNLAERTAIMRNGQPVAVLLDFDDYRALCAAQALARDPQRLAEIQAVARRVRAGDLDDFEAVADVPAGVEADVPAGASEVVSAVDVARRKWKPIGPGFRMKREMEKFAGTRAALAEVRNRITHRRVELEEWRAELDALAKRHAALHRELDQRGTAAAAPREREIKQLIERIDKLEGKGR